MEAPLGQRGSWPRPGTPTSWGCFSRALLAAELSLEPHPKLQLAAQVRPALHRHVSAASPRVPAPRSLLRRAGRLLPLRGSIFLLAGGCPHQPREWRSSPGRAGAGASGPLSRFSLPGGRAAAPGSAGREAGLPGGTSSPRAPRAPPRAEDPRPIGAARGALRLLWLPVWREGDPVRLESPPPLHLSPWLVGRRCARCERSGWRPRAKGTGGHVSHLSQ